MMVTERRHARNLRPSEGQGPERLQEDDGGSSKRRRPTFQQQTARWRLCLASLAAVALMGSILIFLSWELWPTSKVSQQHQLLSAVKGNSLSLECIFRPDQSTIKRSHAIALGIVSFSSALGCGMHLLATDERLTCSIHYGQGCSDTVHVTSDVPLEEGGRCGRCVCCLVC